ncbi:hypothetical protein Aci011_004 [Acinetobacter phage vB_AbaM_B09_Aci01-1]|uniref:Uncharacterized protein n=1 Tax=Acinetobacter phage vB_AbaM_B09_Aci01-1 TaxID=2315466 RepID=A0A386KMB6_9CAUD|nr:hypothetical protein HOU29_gp004 [Acinetobacter phage vB_AbaM_B09_Aci01-1]AYD85613.1 hypothetical protein Aci011_004 [Acinetobacter phage vB_AbaM_B09_Aci01-1]
MIINKVVNHIPHKLKRRVVKKSLRNNLYMFTFEHENLRVRNFHLMIDEVKRFNKVAAAKLEKMLRVKNRDSSFVYCDSLDGCFKWHQTEEGYNFWAEVYQKLRKQRDLDFDQAMAKIDLF